MSVLQFTPRRRQWHPNKVAVIQEHLSQLLHPVGDISETRCTAIAKNISYTFQYLQFLAQINADLELPEVLTALNFKAFVLHGCAVVEALFYYVLASSGAEVDPRTMFKELCERVESERLINLGEDFYTKLSHLRDLRNRVHLHIRHIQSTADADYWALDREDYKLLKSILRALLTFDRFPCTDGRLDLRFLD